MEKDNKILERINMGKVVNKALSQQITPDSFVEYVDANKELLKRMNEEAKTNTHFLNEMDVKERARELSCKLFVLVGEITECIKCAQTEKERMYVRALLNALASWQGELEDYYNHPENINDVECL